MALLSALSAAGSLFAQEVMTLPEPAYTVGEVFTVKRAQAVQDTKSDLMEPTMKGWKIAEALRFKILEVDDKGAATKVQMEVLGTLNKFQPGKSHPAYDDKNDGEWVDQDPDGVGSIFTGIPKGKAWQFRLIKGEESAYSKKTVTNPLYLALNRQPWAP